jgi:hypothetical protein
MQEGYQNKSDTKKQENTSPQPANVGTSPHATFTPKPAAKPAATESTSLLGSATRQNLATDKPWWRPW